MKKSLLIAASSIIALASCNTDTGSTDNSQAIIDSMVNERVEEIRMELQMRNDSIINELAMWRADSILAARKGKTVSTPKPKPQPQKEITTAEEVKEEETTSSSKWGNGDESGTTSKSKWGNDEEKGTTSGSKWGK